MKKLRNIISLFLAVLTALSIPVFSLAASKTENYEPFPGTRYRITSSVWVHSVSAAKGSMSVSRVKGQASECLELTIAVGAFTSSWQPINTVAQTFTHFGEDQCTDTLTCPTIYNYTVGHVQGSFRFMGYEKMLRDVD